MRFLSFLVDVVRHALFAGGTVCLTYVAFVTVDSKLTQNRAGREFEEARRERDKTAESGVTAGPQGPPRRGDAIARLEVPRLELSAMVLEGDDAGILFRGVGHITGTALPGEGGNACLAAHRDSFFRPLKDIRVGDSIEVTTWDGTLKYEVDSVLIVDPDDVWVTHPTSEERLTLISCYPFYYIGHAPRRFIVQASTCDSLCRDERLDSLAVREAFPDPI
jgi:sortase A